MALGLTSQLTPPHSHPVLSPLSKNVHTLYEVDGRSHFHFHFTEEVEDHGD